MGKVKVIIMRFIKVNGKDYKAKDFSFNTICDLQDMGVDLSANVKPTVLLRAYVSVCMGVDKETAGNEIEAHIVNGCNFDEIMETMYALMEESDFFRHLNQTTETETTTSNRKKK